MNQSIGSVTPANIVKNEPPSVSRCLALMDEHTMLTNIREHSFVVARVAEAILQKLQIKTIHADLPSINLVVAGALLHDIAKTRCLKEGCDHAKVGGDICDLHGYPEISEIVREHVWLVDFSPTRYRRSIFFAKELIYYADKRVLHDQIVNLSARLDYILERYGNNDAVRHSLIKKNFHQCQELENWLCHSAGCSPEELLEEITPHRLYEKEE